MSAHAGFYTKGNQTTYATSPPADGVLAHGIASQVGRFLYD